MIVKINHEICTNCSKIDYTSLTMNSVLFDGRQHYLRVGKELLTVSGPAREIALRNREVVNNYPPGRLAVLVLAAIGQGRFSVSSKLRAELERLANSAPDSAFSQSESELVMATKSTASKSTSKPAAKKAASKASAAKPAAKKAASKATAPAKKAASKAAPAPAASAGSGRISTSATITVLAETNPKRAAAATRFDLYKNGMTVAEYVAAGGKRADVSWDVKQGFISLAE